MFIIFFQYIKQTNRKIYIKGIIHKESLHNNVKLLMNIKFQNLQQKLL